MAHKDYVARGRSKKQAPPPPKPSLPWLRIVITITLVAGFSYFLWSININSMVIKSGEQSGARRGTRHAA